VWTVKTELVTFVNEQERQRYQESLGDTLADRVRYIAEVMNRYEYVPKMPGKAALDLVFDTSFPDVQPYLFKVCYSTAWPSSPSIGSTLKNLLKDTLAI
jgi:autophagy-related protein 101